MAEPSTSKPAQRRPGVRREAPISRGRAEHFRKRETGCGATRPSQRVAAVHDPRRVRPVLCYVSRPRTCGWLGEPSTELPSELVLIFDFPRASSAVNRIPRRNGNAGVPRSTSRHHNQRSSYGITGNSPAIVVDAGVQTGCPHPFALTPIGNPAGFVMS